MTSSAIVVCVAVFVACSVEMVEALTIVVAAGVSGGWRPALRGTAAALLTLAAITAALGPAIAHFVPLQALRIVIGGILLVFGLQWLRKALLRAAGYLAKHDEDAIFAREVAAISDAPGSANRGSVAFTVAFKGVFLEGLEVVIAVISLGSTDGHLVLASVAAIAAILIVGGIGIAVARQLSGVPENALKMGVALMLVSFGTFWTGEGIGVHWPGSDLAIPVLIGAFGLVAFVLARGLARRHRESRVGVA